MLEFVAMWCSVLSASLVLWVRIPVTANVVIGFELSHERFVRVYNSGHTFPPPRGNWVPSLRRDCICELLARYAVTGYMAGNLRLIKKDCAGLLG